MGPGGHLGPGSQLDPTGSQLDPKHLIRWTPGAPQVGGQNGPKIVKKSIPISTIFSITFLIDFEALLDRFLIDFGPDLGWPEGHFVL